MESPKKKSTPKSIPQSLASSPNRGSMRNTTFSGSWTKENTKPSEFKLHSQQRAEQRALYNSSVAIKLYIIEQHKKSVEKEMKVIEDEEVRILRREMIPIAQLMPLFDKPFYPQRSTRPLTVPREPFKMNNMKTN